MITDFQGFGFAHVASLLIPLLLAAGFLALRSSPWGNSHSRLLRILLAVLLVLIRGARYVMDAAVGRFELLDLLSLHVCHIDLILLVICLIKPTRALFTFTFTVGIPMGLAVALFPGSTHPEPGLIRAVFFIMSHAMLAVGAVYLCVTERFKITAKSILVIILAANLGLLAVYAVNLLLDANFLYIMYPPQGTLIEGIASLLGWPGYVLALDGLGILCILLMFFFNRALIHFLPRNSVSPPVEVVA